MCNCMKFCKSNKNKEDETTKKNYFVENLNNTILHATGIYTHAWITINNGPENVYEFYLNEHIFININALLTIKRFTKYRRGKNRKMKQLLHLHHVPACFCTGNKEAAFILQYHLVISLTYFHSPPQIGAGRRPNLVTR